MQSTPLRPNLRLPPLCTAVFGSKGKGPYAFGSKHERRLKFSVGGHSSSELSVPSQFENFLSTLWITEACLHKGDSGFSREIRCDINKLASLKLRQLKTRNSFELRGT